MTAATASATSEMIVRHAPAASYTPAAELQVAYTVVARPGFDLMGTYDAPQNRWTIVDRETGIFGHGDDVLTALRDFERAVAEHVDVLQRQPALSDDLAAQLEYLRERAVL